MNNVQTPATKFFLIASALMALSTFLWFGKHFSADEVQYPLLLTMEDSFYVISMITAFFGLISVFKGIQQLAD